MYQPTKNGSCSSTDNDIFDIISMTAEGIEDALNVIRKSFFLYESVCTGVELSKEPKAAKELESLCTHAARDGASLMAVERSTGKVVAVAFNKIQVKGQPGDKPFFETFIENNCKYANSKALINYMLNMDSRCDVFEHYGVDCLLELMFLATLPEYGNKRLGRRLCEESIRMAQELKDNTRSRTPLQLGEGDAEEFTAHVPQLVTALFTSNISRKIGVRLDFEELLEVSYDEFSFNGNTFSSRIGKESPTSVLVAKRLV